MSTSKRIAYLVSQYPAANHTYILREIRELRRLGWRIEVIAISRDIRPASDLMAEERDELTGTFYVKAQGVRGALHAHFNCLTRHPRSYFSGVSAALRQDGVDILQAFRNLLYFTEALIVGQWMQMQRLEHAHIHFSSTVGLLVAKMFPVTISITVHGPAEFQEPVKFRLREKVEASRFICTISQLGTNQLIRFCPREQWGKLETVRLGIDPDVFAPRPRRELEEGIFNIISVARLSPEKAQRILVDAVAVLLKEGRRIRLRLVGEGPDRSVLEKHINAQGLSEAVNLEGAVNQENLKALYHRSDMFALSSLAEGVPVVLMEAMGMEIPCVATRIGGVPELIQDGVDGLLVDPSDVGQLARALARLMDDPGLRGRIAVAGRRKVLQQYNLAKNAALLAGVFERRLLDASPLQTQNL